MTENSFPRVAYFCMEYGLDEKFKIYAGGLGILAGDILKTARELDYPLVGIGILWRRGYTSQYIGEDNCPYDKFPANDYMYDYLEDTGVTFNLNIEGQITKIKVWKLDRLNNAPLYLLDTNLPENGETKKFTERLYAGNKHERIAQEMILGIGGIKALRELNIEPDVYHFNEGHAVLAGTELIRELMKEGWSFSEAWEEIREKIVFTTHTPVREGNEEHSLDLLQQLGAFNGLSRQQMRNIGGSPFNMTVAGLRLARDANGVAILHGETSRKMWANINNRAPIRAITNGINRSTWTSKKIITAYHNEKGLEKAHLELKQELLDFINQKTGKNLAQDKLLIGFARRAATYKRPDLIFRRPEVIEPLLEEGKLQLVFAGKAHPGDEKGKNIIAHLVHMSKKFPDSVVFLENYDMKIGKLMTSGVDVWLNNPRKPLEASGTSGMKAAMNGVLNFSILDGWWPEICDHGVNGWQFGDGYMGENQDQHDLNHLYQVLLEEIIPCYYGDKSRWLKIMRNSIRTTINRYSATRMLEDYYQEMYIESNDMVKNIV
ncbi:MAG: alpha-glucan family phosphorylase [Halanaerobiales bacterium]